MSEERGCCASRETPLFVVLRGAWLLPVGVMRCTWLSDASKATSFFFFVDSDYIEPFVSGQFGVYIDSLLSITVAPRETFLSQNKAQG